MHTVQSLKPTQSIRMCNEVQNPTYLGWKYKNRQPPSQNLVYSITKFCGRKDRQHLIFRKYYTVDYKHNSEFSTAQNS